MDSRLLKAGFRLGALESPVMATLAKLDEQRFSERLWKRDPALWKVEPDHQRVIRNALGWLSVIDDMLGRVDELLKFVLDVKSARFRDAVLLGMGGSSLCPDVCRATFGRARGFLRLHVLDSTVPARVAGVEQSIDLTKTVFLVSSKSGGTVETLSFYKYFYDRLHSVKGERAGENFVAITDPGTSLEKLAQEHRFRRVFAGHVDIGGRYSALSNFGMVPAALAGIDIETMLSRGKQMAEWCAAAVPAEGNPGLVLGVVMAEAARAGRDKLTFVVSPGIRTFGDWVEQLVAESTGKEGKGIVPVVGGGLGEPAAYGRDRLFVYVQLASDGSARVSRQLSALEDAGHPVVRIRLRDKLDLGQEFFRWELATATAGALLGINPFDQPNVAESKDNTNQLLAEFRANGRLPEELPVAKSAGLSLYCNGATRAAIEKRIAPLAQPKMADYLAAFLSQAQPGDYVAVLAYLEPSAENDARLHSVRMRLHRALRLATTVGHGPRYLHSTGQLHKGGPNNGLFILVTADDVEDIPIPSEPYSFSVLKQAQALGDLRSLQAKNRRVVRFHLGREVRMGLERLLRVTEGALERMGQAGGRA